MNNNDLKIPLNEIGSKKIIDELKEEIERLRDSNNYHLLINEALKKSLELVHYGDHDMMVQYDIMEMSRLILKLVNQMDLL